MLVTLVAAVARNGVIGREGGLPWRIPSDMKHFKALTMGKPVVMGRVTFEGLPAAFRPLPGRRNVVMSRNGGVQCADDVVAGVADALALLASCDEVMVAGGSQIYALWLPFADRLELTEIDAEVEGDAFFPAWRGGGEWEEISRESFPAQGEVPPYAFVTYERKKRVS